MKVKAKNIVIIGALSAIAQGVAKQYARVGSRFFLVARRESQLRIAANELRSHGAQSCAVYVADLRVRDGHADIVAKSQETLGSIDVVLMAQGVYPSRDQVATNVDVMIDSLMVNAVTMISFMHRYGTLLQSQRHGTLAVLSSVAGDRGRRNNFHYGSAKAAVSAYASGLRAELAEYGVNVLTIKPGPVFTPMTEHQNMPFMASVEQVAADIVAAIEKRRRVLYTPWYWRFIMAVVRWIPERIFMQIRR